MSDPTRSRLAILAVLLCFGGIRCTSFTGPDDITEFKNVTITYERVLPVPLPEGTGQPTLSSKFSHGSDVWDETAAMTTVDENTFSVGIGIRTETTIGVHVVDPKYPDWVCRRLFVEAADVQRQEIPAAQLYGQVAFVLGNDGKIR
jgi:hypothetical protein